MFKIDQSETYKYPVNVTTLNANGKTEKHSFTAIFHRLPQSDIDHLFAEAQDQTLDDDAFVNKVLAGWEGIKDQDNNDVEFNDTTRAAVCDIHPVRPSIITAYTESLKAVSAKN